MMRSLHDDIESSEFQIIEPQSLSLQDGYDHRDALFGIVPYGISIQEQLYYTTNSFCSSNYTNSDIGGDSGNGGNTLSGHPIDNDAATGQVIPFQSPFVLMIDRGHCSFVQKVRNAQYVGAVAVLIADNTTCVCGAQSDCTNSSHSSTAVDCEYQKPIMADDGTGADITIPSFLILKQDADAIRNVVVVNNQPVRVEMSFRLPTPDGHVEYELWTTAFDLLSEHFLQTFDSAAIALQDMTNFTPRMLMYSGTRAGCKGYNGMNSCLESCTNSGRYCARDPDGDLENGLTGADVVTESLRRICIWNTYGSTNSSSTEWWMYVKNFGMKCNVSDQPMLHKDMNCITNVMKESNIDQTKIEQCIIASGGLTEDVPNIELEKMITARKVSGVTTSIPSLIIVNHVPIRGGLYYRNIFRAICAGYTPDSVPKICQSCMDCIDTANCVETGGICQAFGSMNGTPVYGLSTTSTNSDRITLFLAIILSLSVIVMILAIVRYYRNQLQRRRRTGIRNEIYGILSEDFKIT